MTLKIDNAIEEIERALAGNKPKYANDTYLKNAIRYLQEIKSPYLPDEQQVVLEMLKEETIDRGNPYAGIYWLLEDDEYPNMSNKEFYQVLAAFAQWALEQEEE